MVSRSLNSSGTHRICNWWIAYTFDNPLRRLIHNPPKVLGSYVKAGMTVMDLGCGMGHFSIGMARLVGNTGRVIAVDLQQKMLDVMERRVRRAGLADRILPHRCQAEDIGIMEPVDFILAFWMVHEVPDQNKFFKQLKLLLGAAGRMLIVEPKMHVTAADLERTLAIAQSCGLQWIEKPAIRLSHSALLVPIAGT
ncbi:MAG: class I SAM-dependent methyltransferase [Deltaproteobacteria bacterium]|jgi:ubiquinone/menaquinone biosynthesis C-methylase UbiE|nr:class I SAM-dependent methyltransferase [Deltaproteobacteria bacterium]